MGKSYSKEEVVVAQNANGEATANTKLESQQSNHMVQTLLIVAVVLIVAAVIYYIFKKCRRSAINTLRRELNAISIENLARPSNQ